jgi:hypothetical protein
MCAALAVPETLATGIPWLSIEYNAGMARKPRFRRRASRGQEGSLIPGKSRQDIAPPCRRLFASGNKKPRTMPGLLLLPI